MVEDTSRYASDLASFPPSDVPVPESFDELCEMVEQVKGVRFRELFEALPMRTPSGDEALQAVLDEARRYLEAQQADEDEASEENEGGHDPG